MAALLAALAAVGPAWAADGATAARAASPGPLTLDSLQTVDLPRAFLAAPDLVTLVALQREVEAAATQFRRSIGTYPPKIGIAALGSLGDPSRVNPSMLRAQGIDYVLLDWPAPTGTPLAAPPATSSGARATAPVGPAAPPPPVPSLAENASRWYLLAYERGNTTGMPPAGHTRFVPDWFESALAGLTALPSEQNRRVAWMRERIGQRIPMAKFLEMPRPVAGGAGTRRGATASTGSKPAAPDARQLFDAQALSFARFLGERESDRFIGQALEILLTGRPQSAAFNIAKNLLPHPDVLEKEWVAWVKDGSAPGGAR